MRILYILSAVIFIMCCSANNLNEDDKYKVCLKYEDNVYLIFSQIIGEDQINISKGSDCNHYTDIVNFKNISLSDISIPNRSIIINNTLGEGDSSIVYFTDRDKFYLGLLGVNGDLNLYLISLTTKSVRDLGVRTLSSDFFIDERSLMLATSSYLVEKNDSVYDIDFNYYDLSTLKSKRKITYSFEQSVLDSVLKINPFTIL